VFSLEPPALREGQEPASQAGGSARRRQRFPEEAPDGFARSLLCGLEVRKHPGQEVIEVVGDAPRYQAQGLEPLGSEHLLLEAAFVGYVLDGGDDADDLPCFFYRHLGCQCDVFVFADAGSLLGGECLAGGEDPLVFLAQSFGQEGESLHDRAALNSRGKTQPLAPVLECLVE